jgi:ABC-type antimicrobial peptide transport system permease subunit
VLVPAGSNGDVIVVGVIGNTKNAGLRDAALPAIFVPYTLAAPPTRLLALRTFREPLSVLNAVRERSRELDKELPLGRPITMTEVMGFQTVEPRFNMALFTCFAGLGLALAAVGIYSVISYDVTQRIHEMGVRLALGAKGGDVVALVLRMAARVTALGLAIGLCGSIVVERIARFQAFAATSFDVTSAVCVAAVLFAVALIAAWWPARRAGRLDPVAALRHEA